MVSGDDLLPSFLVKDLASVLCYPLKIIFNLSINSSKFPTVWKTTKVTPVFKKGDPFILSNYRPISILSNFAKIFDQLIYQQLLPNIKPYISTAQHGFLSGRSTTTNLLNIVQTISEVIENRGQIDVIYTDFSRAFDSINHSVLLDKLNIFGCCPKLLNFLASYISGRLSYVSYNGFSSTSFRNSSGVPQGSNLGPLLFNVYINDLFQKLNTKVLGYADDLKICNHVADITDCVRLHKDLLMISKWCQDNSLILNIAKCSVVSYTRKIHSVEYQYDVAGDVIKKSCICSRPWRYF